MTKTQYVVIQETKLSSKIPDSMARQIVHGVYDSLFSAMKVANGLNMRSEEFRTYIQEIREGEDMTKLKHVYYESGVHSYSMYLLDSEGD